MKYETGTKVWVYNPPCRPKAGIIIGPVAGLTCAFYVQYPGDLARHIVTRVYHNPLEFYRLIVDLENDAQDLQTFAREIEEEIQEK